MSGVGFRNQTQHSRVLECVGVLLGSSVVRAGQAIETPFRPRTAAEGEPAPSTKLPLQALAFTMPCDSDIASLVFVVRSGDRSAWYLSLIHI